MTRSDPHLLLHRQFEKQARRTPTAVALYQDASSVTFAELEARAEAIGSGLRARGVREGSVVGVHVERSIDWVAAVLGILETNAAVLPLPPSYPAARIREILEHAALDAVVDDAATRLDPALPARRLDLASLAAAAESRVDAGCGHADQTAFVLCSSGSTGKPKMIARSHRSFQHRLRWTWERHPYGADEVCCQKAHATTTHGIYELFEPLLRGVPVVIVEDEKARNLEVLWDIIRSRGVTRLLIVPSALHSTLDMPGFRPPPLKVVVLMGEYVSTELAARAVAAFPPSTRLYSIYGSTEASSTLVCDLRASLRPGRELPLGTPISEDVRAFVLDTDLQPVEAGDIGTLHVAGTPLFTEYLGSPELTGGVVVTDSAHAERLYDTHDRVRSMPDGSLHFVGRSDDLVKIRGFRVDPKDVERALVSHPGLRRAAVIVRDAGSGHATLVAFVTPADLDRDAVFETLRDRLPPYMIPSAITGVERFPLTASGKLDRVRLLQEHSVRGTTRSDRSATGTEARVAEIWEEVLGHGAFGRDHSFFEVGGSSLSVFAVVHRLRETFGLDPSRLPEQSAYQYPTIEGMAGYVDGLLEGHDGAPSSGTPIQVTLRRAGDPSLPPFFLIASAGGTLGAYERLTGALGTQRAIIGVRDPFVWGERDPVEGFERWVDRYVEAIRERQPHGPYAIGAYSSAGAFGYEIARRLREAGEDVEILVLIDPLALDRRSRARYGWWALRATWARPSVRLLVRLAGWLRIPLGLVPGALRRRAASGLAPTRAEFDEIAAYATRRRGHLKTVSALLELNTGLPLALDDSDFADVAAEQYLEVLQSRVASVMPEIDPASLERLVVQYELQVRSQHAYMLRPYGGRVVLFEPATRHANLVRTLLRPYVRDLDARVISLGEPSERTRALAKQFGPLESHYRSMRDDTFVKSLARAIDDVLD